MMCLSFLRTPRRRRLAGAEDCSDVSKGALIVCCERVRTTEHAPRDPFRVFNRRHDLTELVERGAAALRPAHV